MISFPIPEGVQLPEDGTPVEVTATVQVSGGMVELVAIDGVPLGGDMEEPEEAEEAPEEFGAAFDRRMSEAPPETPPFA